MMLLGFVGNEQLVKWLSENSPPWFPNTDGKVTLTVGIDGLKWRMSGFVTEMEAIATPTAVGVGAFFRDYEHPMLKFTFLPCDLVG